MMNCSDHENDRTGKEYFLVIIPLKVLFKGQTNQLWAMTDKPDRVNNKWLNELLINHQKHMLIFTLHVNWILIFYL